ncbi:4981_t:CDS:2, partial [Acaulospora colombiana]
VGEVESEVVVEDQDVNQENMVFVLLITKRRKCKEISNDIPTAQDAGEAVAAATKQASDSVPSTSTIGSSFGHYSPGELTPFLGPNTKAKAKDTNDRTCIGCTEAFEKAEQRAQEREKKKIAQPWVQRKPYLAGVVIHFWGLFSDDAGKEPQMRS